MSPFQRGAFPVGVRAVEARDHSRDRLFPCEIWYPAAARHSGQDLAPDTQDVYALASTGATRRQAAVRDAQPQPGPHPLVVFSHSSGRWHRRGATFLCTHLASHGYVVGAVDHSETLTSGMTAATMTANRVADVRFLLDFLLEGDYDADAARVGIAGHSFGGWTALAAAAVEWRIRAVVALAPAGSSRPKPGILAAPLTFRWGRDVPTLYVTGDRDVMTPVGGVAELFARTPGTKRLIVVRGADHLHFMDAVEEEHELARAMTWSGLLEWIPREMRPIGELCAGDDAHRVARGAAVAHFDQFLR